MGWHHHRVLQCVFLRSQKESVDDVWSQSLSARDWGTILDATHTLKIMSLFHLCHAAITCYGYSAQVCRGRLLTDFCRLGKSLYIEWCVWKKWHFMAHPCCSVHYNMLVELATLELHELPNYCNGWYRNEQVCERVWTQCGSILVWAVGGHYLQSLLTRQLVRPGGKTPGLGSIMLDVWHYSLKSLVGSSCGSSQIFF